MSASRRPNTSPFPYARVERLWPGETAACIASGPSLTREDVELLRGRVRTIAINTSYRMAPWADVLYAADHQWWDWHKGAPDFPGMKFSTSRPVFKKWGVKVLRRGDDQWSGRDGLSLDPSTLALGKDSGYQAINLAVLFGATRILLLGYDMSRAPDGRRHWHPDHPTPTPNLYREFMVFYPGLAARLEEAGIEVINCTRWTALDVFPKAQLAEALGLEVTA